MRTNLLFKRVLLAIVCIALGIGGGYFMATELFKPEQSGRGILFSISVTAYVCAYIIGDKILLDKYRDR